MEEGEKNNVFEVYNKIAHWFLKNRNTALIEKKYLDELLAFVPQQGKVLDLGCGTGQPILEYLLSKEIHVTGVDASSVMIEIAQTNYPSAELIVQDMRYLNLPMKFDGIVLWHSLFHLPASDQPGVFKLLAQHLKHKGVLLFTSGTERGETWSNGNENVFHASLDTKEYEQLLAQHNFKIIKHTINDPDCGYATTWLAQFALPDTINSII
jgi:SAM-dependent methyltransferase